MRCVSVCTVTLHLLTGAVTADSQSVKERHTGAIHHSLAGVLQIAGHFLIAFGRLSHFPLDLRVTNQQLTQSEGRHTQAHTLTLSLQVIYSPRTVDTLNNTI